MITKHLSIKTLYIFMGSLKHAHNHNKIVFKAFFNGNNKYFGGISLVGLTG